MKQLATAVRALAVLAVLTGLVYPLAVTRLGTLLFPRQVSGSLLRRGGQLVGSELIGQSFVSPGYFWPRPSAVLYDPLRSGATNLSVTSAALVARLAERESRGASADLRYASASGLDPHISPEAARAQLARVAAARQLDDAQTSELARLLEARVEGPQFGLLGPPRVNVLLLNIEVDRRFGP